MNTRNFSELQIFDIDPDAAFLIVIRITAFNSVKSGINIKFVPS